MAEGIDERILLIVRTPPPYGGGELVGAQLERAFAGRFAVLAFRRDAHTKARQGRVTATNVGFGLRYVARSCVRLLRSRPRVLYLDIPKEPVAFLRTSPILLTALALRVRVVGDLAGARFTFLAGSPLRRPARALLRRLHGVRVLGESIAADLARLGVPNTVVLVNGIEEPPGGVPDRPFPDGELRLLYVGKLAVSKGVLTLVDALAAVRDEQPSWRLELVGEWESEATRSRVVAAVEAAGLSERIAVRGLLVGEPKWEAFRRAHLLVHPTTWDGQPVTILEAFSLGLPVVATRVGAIPDTIRDAVDGRLLPDGTPRSVVDGIASLVRDEPTYTAACAAARSAFEERFTAGAFAAGMAVLLERAARGDGQ